VYKIRCTPTAWELAGGGAGRCVLGPGGAHGRPLSCSAEIWKPVRRDRRELPAALSLDTARQEVNSPSVHSIKEVDLKLKVTQ